MLPTTSFDTPVAHILDPAFSSDAKTGPIKFVENIRDLRCGRRADNNYDCSTLKVTTRLHNNNGQVGEHCGDP